MDLDIDTMEDFSLQRLLNCKRKIDATVRVAGRSFTKESLMRPGNVT